MFTANLPAVPYSDPWDVPLQERIKALLSGKRRVAYFYEQANNSTFRYRAYNMVQVLNELEAGEVSAGYFFLDDLSQIENLADLADLLVICRSRYCHRVDDLIAKFRRRDKRVLFDVDDLVFDQTYVHLIMNALDQDVNNSEEWDYWFAYTGRMGQTMRLCDGAITTNEYLAGQIAKFSGLPVSVVPNFINREQLDLSELLFRKKETGGFARDGKIHLGYFSGTPSHNLDFEIIVSALEILLEDNPQVKIALAGYINPHPSLRRFGRRILRYPFYDYVNLQLLVSSIEFNLIPLQPNVFTQCKSELKFFEAAIAGTLSIASPCFTYASAIRNGENGYIARGHQWASVIRQAIDNIDRYQHIATTAFADARTKYAWFKQREIILKALGIE